MDDTTAGELAEQYTAGTISNEDKERLFSYYRELFEMDDEQIELMLITGSDDYGKPDEEGNVLRIRSRKQFLFRHQIL